MCFRYTDQILSIFINFWLQEKFFCKKLILPILARLRFFRGPSRDQGGVGPKKNLRQKIRNRILLIVTKFGDNRLSRFRAIWEKVQGGWPPPHILRRVNPPQTSHIYIPRRQRGGIYPPPRISPFPLSDWAEIWYTPTLEKFIVGNQKKFQNFLLIIDFLG